MEDGPWQSSRHVRLSSPSCQCNKTAPSFILNSAPRWMILTASVPPASNGVGTAATYILDSAAIFEVKRLLSCCTHSLRLIRLPFSFRVPTPSHSLHQMLCTMYNSIALAALSFGAGALAQQAGTLKAETHPPLSISRCTSSGCTNETHSITLDANWRWVHDTSSSTNCRD
jgi:hypothetical protein